MEMYIQIQRTAKPLNERDCTGFRPFLSQPCFFGEMGCNRAVYDTQHLAHQLWPAGEQESQLKRKTICVDDNLCDHNSTVILEGTILSTGCRAASA